MESIAVVGLGYVGLPLAVELGKSFDVKGFDVDTDRVEELRDGFDRTNECSRKEISDAKGLTFCKEAQQIAGASFYIVTVPTPVDASKTPDLGPLRAASKTIGSLIKAGAVIVYESTVFPGATEEVCVPILESVSGLKFNEDFFCGYSPERINPGDKEHRISSITKIVSGSNPSATERIAKVYETIIHAGIHITSSIKVAEAAKVIENTQRDVNIALINELSCLFEKLSINTAEVLAAAETKWNFLSFRPGLVGGHCIGVDPYYLTHKAQQVGHYPEMILAGRRVNDSMAKEVAVRLVKLMSAAGTMTANAKVLILGAAFKPNCPDMRNSKVVDLVQELESFSLSVDILDSVVSRSDLSHHFGGRVVDELEANRYSAILVAVAHDDFARTGLPELRKSGSSAHVVFDVMGLFPPSQTDGQL